MPGGAFDANLSFADKLAQWRVQSAVSLQLVMNVMMLSLRTVGVVKKHALISPAVIPVAILLLEW